MGCTTLVESADKYIEQCFHEVSLSEEYLNLSVHEIKNLLQRNELRVERYVIQEFIICTKFQYELCSEEQVFEACMRWVKLSENRSHFLPELLAEVRLPLLSPLYLTDRVATEELIRTSHQCRLVF